MKIFNTNLDKVIIIQPQIFEDKRGLFLETFNYDKYLKVGINFSFVQDNFSVSKNNVLRGLHYQKTSPQGKLVYVNMGEIFDVAVNINPKSKDYGRWTGNILSSKNHCQMWIPPGFAHGFLVTSEIAHVAYKCTEKYNPQDEATIAWNDSDINIKWPSLSPILSKKDENGERLSDCF